MLLNVCQNASMLWFFSYNSYILSKNMALKQECMKQKELDWHSREWIHNILMIVASDWFSCLGKDVSYLIIYISFNRVLNVFSENLLIYGIMRMQILYIFSIVILVYLIDSLILTYDHCMCSFNSIEHFTSSVAFAICTLLPFKLLMYGCHIILMIVVQLI